VAETQTETTTAPAQTQLPPEERVSLGTARQLKELAYELGKSKDEVLKDTGGVPVEELSALVANGLLEAWKAELSNKPE
jgi:hypothetical protein